MGPPVVDRAAPFPLVITIQEVSIVTPVLYAMRPSGPELTQRALLRRLRCLGVRVVALPAGHYILGQHRSVVDHVVAEINTDLYQLCAERTPDADGRLDVLFRPIPGPTDDEGR